jgi:hypothetical protein
MRTVTTILALLLSTQAFAWQTPHQAIDEFLQFELSGGRLQSWQFNRYLAVGEDYDEPGWDGVHVIEKAKLISLACSESRCIARVQFNYVPTKAFKSPNVIPHPDGGSEILEYTVVHSGNEWLLQSSGDYPRVAYTELKRRGATGL